MLRSIAILVVLVLASVSVQGLSTSSTPRQTTTAGRQAVKIDSISRVISRDDFCRRSLIGVAIFLGGASPVCAEDHAVTECKVAGGEGRPPNCVSTASVKQVDCYSPPWTFESSASEAMARVKGVVATDGNLELLEVDDKYLKVKANRGIVADEIEFVFNEADKVVMFKSSENSEGGPSISDFGANRRRLEDIRKKAGIFDVMGQGLTADSYEGRQKANGPLGQLKAFYGLQSGEGFEDVFEK